MVNTGSDTTLENPVKLKKHMNVYSLHKDTVLYYTALLSTPSETDTFGTSTKFLSQRDVHVRESQKIKGVKKARDQLHMSILQRWCSSCRGVHGP